jgi:hypothetical protein
MEIGTFSCNRITTIFCHTWNGVYVAGIGSGCRSVGPCPPTKCLTLPSYKMFDLALLQNVWPCPPIKFLEQIYVHCVTFSTVKSSRPHSRIQRWHFPFRFALVWGTGFKRHLSCVHIWISTVCCQKYCNM